MNENYTPAVEATIKLGAGVSVDGYMLPKGEFRYGLSYLGVLMGRSRNYYGRALNLRGTKKEPKFLKHLLSKGFTGYQIQLKVTRDGKRGASVISTISYDDFCLAVEAEAEHSNPKAIALLTSSFRELLRSRTQAAFNITEDSLEQRQKDFEANYEAYLERHEAWEEDQKDLADLWLPGDELYYPQFRDWEEEESDFYWECWETA